MNQVRRALRLAAAALASYAVRLLARTRPQRWCPPAISLRLFRASSAPGAAIVAEALRRHLPPGGRTVRTDLGAGASQRRGLLDLVLPPGPGPHPLVIWFHGGGWHFGGTADVLPYLELLALRGYAGAAVRYPLAPRAAYPAAPRQGQRAVEYLSAHAAELGLDPGRFVVAGDSAGAQVAAELATTMPDRFCGALFFCGIFDPRGLEDSDRMFAAALESAMWSLTRSRRWRETAACGSMTVVERVTEAFPPTFLAAANHDPLYRRQTPPMASRLRELGVPVEEYVAGTEAAPCFHQFQFRLDTPEGAEVLARATTFLERVTTGTSNSH